MEPLKSGRLDTQDGRFFVVFSTSQKLGVPEGFQPLSMGRIRNFEAALEPGPLHSKTIFRINAEMESPGYVH